MVYSKGHVLPIAPFFANSNQPLLSLPYHPLILKSAQANIVGTTSPQKSTWLLDRGASHHVTTNISTLSCIFLMLARKSS